MLEETPRVERLETPDIQDETSHLWAISYADFLMVLLSFFILFFSVSPEATVKEQVNVIDTSTLGRVPDSSPAPPKRRETASLGGLTISNTGELDGLLKGIKLEKTLKREQVVFLFPDDIFRKGKIAPEPRYASHMNEVLTKILPFRNRVELLFIGHTDGLKYKKPSNKYLEDNFDLSVLRATKALQGAVRLGFSPDQVSAKGSADSQRASRTLSLVIRLRQDIPVSRPESQ